MFVDDTKLFRVIESINDYDILQSDLDFVLFYLIGPGTGNYHLMSKKKCKSLHYTESNQNYTYNMNSIPLDKIKTESDLGSFLTINRHSSYILIK